MLRINLRDNERVIVNGSVLRAHGRLSLYVENESAILRDRDVMQPDEANTPAKRLYFACMLAYIHPERAKDHLQTIAELAGELYAVLVRPDLRQNSLDMLRFASEGQFYKALIECRKIIHYEAEILARATGPENLHDPIAPGSLAPAGDAAPATGISPSAW